MCSPTSSGGNVVVVRSKNFWVCSWRVRFEIVGTHWQELSNDHMGDAQFMDVWRHVGSNML